MKLKLICYHLERAEHFRRLAELPARPPGRSGYMAPGGAAARAVEHEERAARYLAEGLKKRAGLKQNANARQARKWRRRNRVDPRTDPAVAGQGRGCHNRGRADWGKHAGKDSD
jgi:hypothetical protein